MTLHEQRYLEADTQETKSLRLATTSTSSWQNDKCPFDYTIFYIKYMGGKSWLQIFTEKKLALF